MKDIFTGLVLMTLFLKTSAYAQVKTGIENGEILSRASEILSIESVNRVESREIDHYDYQLRIDMSITTGVQTKKSIISYFVKDGELYLLESADNSVWAQGSIGLGIRKKITVEVPYNQMKFIDTNGDGRSDIGVLLIKNKGRPTFKITKYEKDNQFTIENLSE